MGPIKEKLLLRRLAWLTKAVRSQLRIIGATGAFEPNTLLELQAEDEEIWHEEQAMERAEATVSSFLKGGG